MLLSAIANKTISNYNVVVYNNLALIKEIKNQ